jgi:hypothetical protein
MGQDDSETFQQRLDCHLCTVDTVRNTHAVIGIPGENQAWAMRHARGDMSHAVQMPNVILRHRFLVACDAYCERLVSETQQLPQVMNDSLLYPDIGACQLLLLQRTTNKGTQ